MLLLVAARQYRGRPQAGEVAPTPFALIASIGVATPVVLFFSLGDRAPAILDRMKTWMGQNNAVIMAVLCLVIGVKLIGQALSGLTS